MGDVTLPKEWANTSIGEVCIINPKNKVEDSDLVGFLPMVCIPQKFGDKPTYQTREWSSVKKGYTHFQENDVIFAKVTPCFENGKSMIVENCPSGFGSGSSELIVLRTNPARVVSKLLLHLVRTYEFKELGARNMTGAVGLRRVPLDFVAKYPFPLPPLAEQKEIANRLDDLLARVDILKTRLDSIPAILKRFRQSTLAAAVSGKLTEEWRGKISGHYPNLSSLLAALHEDQLTLAKTIPQKNKIDQVYSASEAPIGLPEELPSEWLPTNLAKLCESFSYGTSAKSSKSGEVPVLRMGNIQNGVLDWDDLVYTSTKKEIHQYELQPKDILFNRTNSPELVGKTAIYKGEKKAIYAGYLIRARCLNLLVSEFLNFALNSPYARNYCWQVKTDGVSQSNINAQKLGAFVIPLPSIEEQTEIVRRVEELFAFADQVEQRVKDAQTRANHLTQSIIAKAFRGELTADWRAANPDLITGQNSAEALLARIKSERKNQTPKNKTCKN